MDESSSDKGSKVDLFTFAKAQEAANSGSPENLPKKSKLKDTPANGAKFVRNRLLQVSICLVAGMVVFEAVVGRVSFQAESLEISALEDAGFIDPALMRRYEQQQGVVRGNPKIHLYEKLFCRGYQTATFCKERPLHPYLDTLARFGIDYKPKQKRVPVRSQWKFSNKAQL